MNRQKKLTELVTKCREQKEEDPGHYYLTAIRETSMTGVRLVHVAVELAEAAHKAGVEMPEDFWKEVIDMIVTTSANLLVADNSEPGSEKFDNIADACFMLKQSCEVRRDVMTGEAVAGATKH